MVRNYLIVTVLVAVGVSLSGCGSAGPLSETATGVAAVDEAAIDEAASEEMAAPSTAQRFVAPLARNTESPFAERPDEGSGPGWGGDQYDSIVENQFVAVHDAPRSTFSIDVDTASYSKTRMYLLQQNVLPPPDAIRIEELINYFDYDYSAPSGKDPFAVHVEVAGTPWHPRHLLARIGIQGRRIERERPPSNLVFLLDVSGSMERSNKLPLVKQGMRLLASQMGERDRVSIVVYAGAAGLVLPATSGENQRAILDALDRLHAGGSTNGGDGIRLAYRMAEQNRIEGGVNRLILCTDGDFNVGTTGTGELVRLAEQHAREGIYLTVLGFGMGNHNDAMLEQLSNKANGNYAFIDTQREARKVLLEQLDSTLVTIAKDVKIQVEFNPAHVAAYRLIGYENRRLQAEDFNDDRKDAGEVGAGHAITALYELVPAGSDLNPARPRVDDLKYQTGRQLSQAGGDELLNLKLRYKLPDEQQSQLRVVPVKNIRQQFTAASRDFQFAAAVASFGMLLRGSEHRGDASYDAVLEIAAAARGADKNGHRGEFLELVAAARGLAHPEIAASSYYRPPFVTPHVDLGPQQPRWNSLLALAGLVAFLSWLAALLAGVAIVVWAYRRHYRDRLKMPATAHKV